MAGHLGAAVIAGYSFGEEHAELDEKVQRAIEQDLDHIIGGDESLPVYENERAMAEIVIDDLIDDLIESAAVRRQGFGRHFHIINHATALTELSRFGCGDLARSGLAAHRHHLLLHRSLPDVEEELGNLTAHDPRTPQYWDTDGDSQWSAHLTHRIKTMYGFFTLLRFIGDAETRQQAEDKFLYLMA